MLSVKQNIFPFQQALSLLGVGICAQALESKCLHLSVSGRLTGRLSLATVYLPVQAIGFSSSILCCCVPLIILK